MLLVSQEVILCRSLDLRSTRGDGDAVRNDDGLSSCGCVTVEDLRKMNGINNITNYIQSKLRLEDLTCLIRKIDIDLFLRTK